MKLNVVTPRTGLKWVREGVRTFMRQPLALAGLFFMYVTAVVVVSQIPVLGIVIGGLLVPAATLGLMAATAEATKGRFPMPSILISSFRAGRQQARAMLLLGAIYTVGSVVATGLAQLISGGPAGVEAGEIDTSVLVALLFHVPLFMMFWYAPALVHWHGVSPTKSIFFSVVAVVRNFGAHVVYALGWLGVFVATGSVFGLLGNLLGGPKLAQAMMLPVALLMAAMFSSSMYFSFRDSFSADAAPEAEATP